MKPIPKTVIALLITLGLAVPGWAGQRHGGGSAGAGGAMPRASGSNGRAVPRGGGIVGHAVPRAGVSARAPRSVPYRPYRYGRNYYPFYPFYYAPHLSLGFYYSYPGYYGYGYPGYGYPYYGYGYGATPYSGEAPASGYGAVRIQDAPRDAEVNVDGSYAGIAGDFEGWRKALDLQAGPHRIEIRAPGFQTLVVDVNVRPGQTITYRARMRPQ